MASKGSGVCFRLSVNDTEQQGATMCNDPDPSASDPGYVNGRTAADMQNDRVRHPAGPHQPETTGARPRPRFVQRVGRFLRRLVDQARTDRRVAGVGLAAGAVLLGACSGSTTSAPEAQPSASDTSVEVGATASAQSTTDTVTTGSVACDDVTDDGTVVDEEANAAYTGDGYTADTVEVTLDVSDDAIAVRTQENPDKIDREPAGPLRMDLWFSSADGAERGLVRMTAPGRFDITVEAGPDAQSLEPLEGASPRFGAPGGFLMSIDRSALPVLDGPFRWAFVETIEGNGTADVCPNPVDVEQPLADPDAMSTFPG